MPYAKCGVDINSDGLDDVVRFSKEGVHLDIQLADNRFDYKFYAMKIVNLPIWSICAGDLNGDYYNDLLLAGSSGVSTLLYHGNENRFEEIPAIGNIYSQRSTLQDIDGDGDLDAFVCNDEGASRTYENDGKGNLVQNPQLINISNLPGNYSAIWTDYNNDNNTDLYISKCRVDAKPGDEVRTNLLYKNNGDGTFTEVAKLAGVADNAQSWSTAIEDFDNDGDMDFFVINHDENNKFFRNNGDGTFSEIIASTGIDRYDLGGFENLTGDFNNDGNIDIVSDLKSELYLGKGDLTFEAHDLPFKPAAIADLNNDGFLDVTQRSQLWVNEGNNNHWVKFKLYGYAGNTNGIGAKVKIVTSKGAQVREVRSGQGYSPMGTLDVHFGLGRDSIIDSLMVYWPSGRKTKMANLIVDTTYKVVESFCIIPSEPLSLPDTFYLCKGDTLPLSIKKEYELYKWSNGDFNSSTYITTPGRYFVIYLDSLLCGAISKTVQIIQADTIKPKINVIGSSTHICEGETLMLKAVAANTITWSNGNKNKSIDVKSSGKYYFVEDAMCIDGKFYSDTVDVIVNELTPIEIDSINTTSDSVTIFLNGNNCAFFENPITKNILFEGCEYTIARPSEDIILYAERRLALHEQVISCGKVDTAGFRNDITNQKQMYFTIWDTITLESVDMYINKSSAEGIRTIMIKDWTSNMVYNEEHTLVKGKNTVGLGKKLYPGRYSLTCDRSDQLMNIGPQDYPFPIGDVGTIDSASVSLNFYPYFYNWQVRKETKYCTSQRMPLLIEALATNSTIDGDALHVYPNPAIDKINVASNSLLNPTNLKLSNVNGSNIKFYPIIKDSGLQIDINSLPAGVYYLSYMTDGKIYYKAFIKK